MKKLLLSSIFSLMVLAAVAQVPLVSIRDIQFRNQTDLAACSEASTMAGDTVRVRGVIMMDFQYNGGNNNTTNSGYETQIFDPSDSLWYGITVRASAQATSPTDLSALLAGDSVEIVGIVSEFGGETQLNPVPGSSNNLTFLGISSVPVPRLTSIGELNDNQRVNILTTGERLEGAFVEFQNVTVTAVDPFGGNRVSFVVKDAAGNKINVSDRYAAARTPAAASNGTLIVPSVGTMYSSLRGVIKHSGNGCLGSGRGYELHPFDSSHYQFAAGTVPPVVTNLTRNPATPTSAQATTVSADIQDSDGTITSATLLYAVGINNTNFISVNMTLASANIYTADIPASAYNDGDFVKYYVQAVDNQANAVTVPNVTGSDNPKFFRVRDNGTQIYDVQYTPYSDGISGYEDLSVTITGVVTATLNDLGYVYIQQENQSSWAGIHVRNSTDPTILNANIGDKLSVTGSIREYGFGPSGFTIIENITSVNTAGTGTITPLVFTNPDIFTNYTHATHEPLEGMLISVTSPSGIYVVEQNADAPSNFAEWRIGDDQFDPSAGLRVLTGRQSSTSFSSENTSYINDMQYAANLNTGITPIVVEDIATGTIGFSTEFDTVTGIVMHSYGNVKLTPRNNNDFANAIVSSISPSKEFAGKVSLYPNPATDNFTVKFDLDRAVSGEVNIFDLSGKLVKAVSMAGVQRELQISTAAMQTGMYIVRVQDAQGQLINVSKLSVQ